MERIQGEAFWLRTPSLADEFIRRETLVVVAGFGLVAANFQKLVDGSGQLILEFWRLIIAELGSLTTSGASLDLMWDWTASRMSTIVPFEGRMIQVGRLTSVAAVAGILLATASANGEQASFACMQATRPIEVLICSDPVLTQLDGALGNAYTTYRRSLGAGEARQALLREQRAWLRRRYNECGIPTSGDGLSVPQRWQAAPCLVQMYRGRLAALGQPQKTPFQPEEVTGAADFIHPFCLELALGSADQRRRRGRPSVG